MRPITDILIEFSRGVPAALLTLPVDALTPDEGLSATAGPAGPDLDAVIAEARDAAMAEARAVAAASCDAQLEGIATAHAAELSRARAEWAAGQGAALAARLEAGLAALETGIADTLAAVLVPLLDAAARVRAADAVRGAIAELLAGGEGALIEVAGPADLVAPIRAAFAGRDAVAVVEADQPDVSVRSGSTVIASQAEAWSGRLHAALAGVTP